MKLVEYVSQNVELSLHLRNHVRSGLSNFRKNHVSGFTNPKQHKEALCIQVGLDFIERPVTERFFEKSRKNEVMLEGCVSRCIGVSTLAIHNFNACYTANYLNGDECDDDDIEAICGCSLTEFEELQQGTRDAIWSTFRDAVELGRCDGFHNGEKMMATILGNDPWNALWLPIESREDFDDNTSIRSSCTTNDTNLRYAKIPVSVETPQERDSRMSHLNEIAMSRIESLERLITKSTRYEMLLLLSRRYQRKPVPKLVRSNERAKKSMRKSISRTMKSLYQIGQMIGFEAGQKSNKCIYSRSFDDEKIYTLLGDKREDWLVVDTFSPVSCHCGLCPHCIEQRSSRKELRNLMSDFQGASLKLDAFGKQLDKIRCKK